MKRIRILHRAPWGGPGPGRFRVHFIGGGFPENQTTETTSKMDPVLAREVGPFMKFVRGNVEQPFKPYDWKKLTAGFNPDQEAAFNIGRQGSGAYGQYQNLLDKGPFQGGIGASETTADNYLNQILGGGNITGDERQASGFLGSVYGGRISPEERAASNFLGSFYNNRQNPYFEDQLGIGRRRIGEQFSESIAPQMAGKYALSGAFGGTAQSEAEGIAQRELGRTLGEYETGSRSAEQERRYAQGLQAAGLTEATAGRRIGQGLQAAGLTEATAGRRAGQGLEASGLIENTAARRAQNSLQDALQRAGIIGQQENAFQNDFIRRLGVGSQIQDNVQSGLDARYGQFQREQNYPRETFAMYRDAIAALTGAAPAGTSAASTSSGGGPGVAQQAVGAATTAAALYALYSAYTASTAASAAAAAPALAACWVAREVFGEKDIRWVRFWVWLECRAPLWFRNMYRRHGETVARFLKRHTWIKPAIRWWMQKRIES